MTEDTDTGMAHRLALAEHQAQTAHHELLRTKVIHAYGIGPEDAETLLTATDEDTLMRQAERIAAMPTGGRPRGNYVPREGTYTQPKPSKDMEMRQFARELFNGNYDPL